ncbi:MAG: hypothetical protein QM682_00325 [Paracoccus sp. (in: a-proteobacteria)]|uniref:hypothetical protein n=1 Tax=Paracoccus sp. TaxID=267 RepID=UPI0039E4A09B
MAIYKMLVWSDPSSPDREDAYNDWYSASHMPDILKVPGVVSAQRLSGQGNARIPQRYLAIYSLDTDDPEAVVAEIRRRVKSGEISSAPELIVNVESRVLRLVDDENL